MRLMDGVGLVTGTEMVGCLFGSARMEEVEGGMEWNGTGYCTLQESWSYGLWGGGNRTVIGRRELALQDDLYAVLLTDSLGGLKREALFTREA